MFNNRGFANTLTTNGISYEDFKNGMLDEEWVAEIESRDNIFPEIEYRMYRTSWL